MRSIWTSWILAVAPPQEELPEPVFEFAEAYAAAFEEAQARNAPVVILDFDGWSEAKGLKVVSFHQHKRFALALRRCVVLAASQEHHSARRERVNGEPRDVCAQFGGIPCSVHQATLPLVYQDYAEKGVLASPLVLVAAPDKKELLRLEGEATPEDVLPRLERILADLGPGMERAAFREASTGLADARRLVDQHDFRPAALLLARVAELAVVPSLREEVSSRQEELTAIGRERLEEAQGQWQGGAHRAALFALDRVAWDFPGLEPGKEADRTLKAWLKEPAAKPYRVELEAEQEARQLYSRAEEVEAQGEGRRALPLLRRLIDRHPESLWADKARVMADRLEAEAGRSKRS